MNGFLQNVYQTDMTQPRDVMTDYGYDTQDNQTSITDPNGNPTQYFYDDFGRKNQTISPDTGTTDYVYDEAGNLTQREDANATAVNYTYDALNRLTGIQSPSDPNQNVTFTYDSTQVSNGIGRLTGRTDPSGTYVFHYDSNGSLTREEKTINGVPYTTQYTYNDNNILTSITYPTGRTITYTPDQAGRISQVDTTINGNPKTLTSHINYLPFGGITGLIYGNGLTLSQGYDNQYRISSIVVGSIINLAYEYDPNGNIISIIDSVNPPEDLPIDDPAGYTYQTGTNRLTHIAGAIPADFGYDANGNITSENTWNYVYDLSNQLIRVLDGTNQIAEYTYNGEGQRIKKVTQAETRIFHYDLQGHLIVETDVNGDMTAEYVYLGDQLLAMIKPGELGYYFHNDHLGTPQVLTDESQVIAWKAAYTPFGQAAISIETVENPFRFPGQYYDQETGLHYNYFRYYDPTTGRYISPDPIGLEGGINLFVYVANNPINSVDRLGLLGIPQHDPRNARHLSEFYLGSVDMFRGWIDMMDADTIDADAYFHCRANCEGSKRGPGGYEAAKTISQLREAVQKDEPTACAKDEAANIQGQYAGKEYPDPDCYKACSNLIPPWGIPARHLPPNADPKHIYRPRR